MHGHSQSSLLAVVDMRGASTIVIFSAAVARLCYNLLLHSSAISDTSRVDTRSTWGVRTSSISGVLFVSPFRMRYRGCSLSVGEMQMYTTDRNLPSPPPALIIHPPDSHFQKHRTQKKERTGFPADPPEIPVDLDGLDGLGEHSLGYRGAHPSCMGYLNERLLATEARTHLVGVSRRTLAGSLAKLTREKAQNISKSSLFSRSQKKER